MDRSSQSKIVKLVAMSVAILTAVILLFCSFYTLNEDQDAVVSTFGTPSIVESSGLQFRIPFVQKVTKVDMSVRGMPIGYTPGSDATIENESLMITNDFNFVSVDFYVEWQVTDAVRYVYSAANPELMLKTLAMSYIRDTVGSYSIDEVLTTGKAQIQSEIKEKLVTRLEAEQVGVTVRSVSIQDAEPPTSEVSAAFKAVEDSKQQAEKTVNEANTYRSQQIPSAEAKANAVLNSAEATKQARIQEAQGQIARFTAMYEEYIKYPDVTKTRMYYEVMEELLPKLKVIIQDSSGNIINVLGKEAE